jgi:hypothetical protein
MKSTHAARPNLSTAGCLVAAIVVLSAAPLAQRAGPAVDARLVKLLADREQRAGRLQLTPASCLGLDGHRNPPGRLLRELEKLGLRFRKASACIKPANGILFTVGVVEEKSKNTFRSG